MAGVAVMFDATFGVVYLNNRYHDPITGQFISVDPLVASTGEPYIYGSSNPITLSDPDGLFSCYVPDNPKACQGDLESTWTDSGTGAGSWYSNGSGSHLVSSVSRGPRVLGAADYGLPAWVPMQTVRPALGNAALFDELWELDRVLNMPLDDFGDRWVDAEDQPGHYDWTNDGCSDRNAVTLSHFGCIRHDFLYRNARRVDAAYGLEGAFRENAAGYKGLVDERLAGDIHGWSDPFSYVRAALTYAGVATFGDGFYQPWNEDDWSDATKYSPYGDSRWRVIP